MEGRDGAEKEQLQRQPLARAHPVQDHVGRDLKEDNSKRKHLLADIELVLRDADVLSEVVGDCIGHVAAVQFCVRVRRRSISRKARENMTYAGRRTQASAMA